MPLRIYNSLTQKKEEFVPRQPGKVGMYVCGITAYDECHLGHARAAIIFDVIYRYLKYKGFDVTYVRNFTDVDDKIIKKSEESGLPCELVSNRYIESYKKEMSRLGVLPPTEEPKATEHINEMLGLISRLEKRGYAYAAGGDVFYSVRKFDGYGKLSHKRIDELESGARIEIDPRKRDPLDFALWKSAKPGEPRWPSPWGDGRPGWHIECSAMSTKYLGDTFDIHGGGRDLIFPHHENEIAQSEGACGGGTFARYWIHNGFVNINAEKMSKSLGNIRTIPAILEKWDPEVVRYFLLSAHYASPIDFTDEAMENAKDALVRFYETMLRLKDADCGNDSLDVDLLVLETSMDDDFNTAALLGDIFEGVRKINRELDKEKRPAAGNKEEIFGATKKISDVLGIFGKDPKVFLDGQKKKGLVSSAVSETWIEKLISEREKARKAKEWLRADEIRKELSSKGIILKDDKDGTTTWTTE